MILKFIKIENYKTYIKFLKIGLPCLVLLVVFINIINYVISSNNKDINIVFTADSNYLPYTKVAIKSAIVNKNKDSIYHIYVLGIGLTSAQINSFNFLNEDKAEVKVIPVSFKDIQNIQSHDNKNYVTRADLFKFIMPKLFPDLNKILYIDSDIVINKDLSKLYNTNINHYSLAAVKRFDNPEFIYLFGNLYWSKYQYNCGVLLINLKKWRKDNITSKLIQAKEEDYSHYMSQGVLNQVLPLWRIKQISPIYNTNAKIDNYFFREEHLKIHYFPFLIDCNNADDLQSKSVIIHYSGYKKPWNTKNLYNAEIWWKYAKMIDPNWK